MTTELIIIAIFGLVDDRMPMIPKQPQANLYPSERVTIGNSFALRGDHFQASHRWLKRGYDALLLVPVLTPFLLTLIRRHVMIVLPCLALVPVKC